MQRQFRPTRKVTTNPVHSRRADGNARRDAADNDKRSRSRTESSERSTAALRSHQSFHRFRCCRGERQQCRRPPSKAHGEGR